MLKLAGIFQDKMVLQRGKPVRIWGIADPDETVRVQIQGKTATTKAGQSGNFEVLIEPLMVSSDEALVAETGNSQIRLEQIAVGEVWIAGGQSNMEFFMEFEKHISEERENAANTANAEIRFYDVPQVAFVCQAEAFDYSRTGVWRTLTGDDIGYFSAVGYYFEKYLHSVLHVPTGIIGCDWGGTRIASWMDPDTVKEVGQFWIKEFEKSASGLDMKEYYEQQKMNPSNDRGSMLENPFYRFMLPKTHTQEENIAFLSQLGEGPGDYIAQLLPENIPGSLYEHMVKTIAGFTVRGVLWYQGESDDEADGGQYIYADMLAAMINNWRSLWKDQLPFLIVQLPGWERWLANENHDFAAIRRAQQTVAEQTEDAYLCSAGDAGERFDIHPKDKKMIGDRLALLALNHIYHEPVLSDAPRCISAEWKHEKIILKFEHAGEGLEVRGGELRHLSLSANGEDIMYSSRVSGDKVILEPAMAKAASVKISFAQTAWYLINLYNSTGIPALPFEMICHVGVDADSREEKTT